VSPSKTKDAKAFFYFKVKIPAISEKNIDRSVKA
jgi:hypothetical protein